MINKNFHVHEIQMFEERQHEAGKLEADEWSETDQLHHIE